jgi:putative phosphoesterase
VTTSRAPIRVAALYDIHANLPALEAVLDDVRQSGIDEIVIGGDVIPGPMPRETLARLLDLNRPMHFIMGNGDREVLAQIAGRDVGGVPEHFRASMRWNAEQLTAEQAQRIAGWPATLRLDIRGVGAVLFCHATPRSDTEIFTSLTPQDRLLPIVGELPEVVVVCGHTHMQFDRLIGTKRVLNAGSVGMPFGEPGAYWLLLGPGVEFRHTRYDLTVAANRIRETEYPLADDFARSNVLQPPSEQAMLEAFGKVELK